MYSKIFALHDGNTLAEFLLTPYEKEEFLQNLIERYPEILAGDQINQDYPQKWLMISREIGVPSEQEGANQWYLDHLLVDQDAIPTFVEVKRCSDTRIRREVVAQMLDYAANAISYWPIDAIRELHTQRVLDGGSDTLASIGIDDEESFWQSVGENLRSGKIRLIFASDHIPATLQRIIEYLNGQMVDTEVLGLEIKQFLSTDRATKIYSSSIIGNTGNADTTKHLKSRNWDEESFLAQVIEMRGDKVAELCQRLFRSSEGLGFSIKWGRGKQYGTCYFVYEGVQKHYLFSMVNNWGKFTRVSVSFGDAKPPFNSLGYRTNMKNALECISGVQIPDDKLDKYPSFLLNQLIEEKNFSQFIDIMRSYIEDAKEYEYNSLSKDSDAVSGEIASSVILAGGNDY